MSDNIQIKTIREIKNDLIINFGAEAADQCLQRIEPFLSLGLNFLRNDVPLLQEEGLTTAAYEIILTAFGFEFHYADRDYAPFFPTRLEGIYFNHFGDLVAFEEIDEYSFTTRESPGSDESNEEYFTFTEPGTAAEVYRIIREHSALIVEEITHRRPKTTRLVRSEDFVRAPVASTLLKIAA